MTDQTVTPLPQTIVGNIEEYIRADREQRGRIRTVFNPSTQDAVAYLHPGQIELWLRKEVTKDALVKLRDFVDKQIESHPCA